MFLGVDIGSQSVKALILDRAFRPVGFGSAPLSFIAGPANAVEQNPQHWLDALHPAIAEALQSAGTSRESILSLGIGGQLDGCLPVDGAGQPLHSCLTWMDRRADAEAELVPAEVIRRRCGLIRDPSHMGAKIAWFQRNMPYLSHRTALYHQPVSFVVQQLTGAAIMDRALASTTMLYDLKACGWSNELLVGFGIDETNLPALGQMTDAAGTLNSAGAKITGLEVGLTVAVGTGDDFTNAIGAGLLSPGGMLCQVGTGEVVGALHHECVVDDGRLLETHQFTEGTFFIENPGWLSGGAIVWLLQLLRLSGLDELNELARAVPPGAEGVLFIPALTGAMAPEWNADVHACFHNLQIHHKAGHLIRAVLEGTAFAMRDVQLRLADMGVRTERIILAGGGANSKLWAQIRADVAQLPVNVSETRDASPLGAAILGAVAIGAIRSIGDAEPKLPPARAYLTPDSTLARTYQNAYSNYHRLFAHLKSMASRQ